MHAGMDDVYIVVSQPLSGVQCSALTETPCGVCTNNKPRSNSAFINTPAVVKDSWTY